MLLSHLSVLPSFTSSASTANTPFRVSDILRSLASILEAPVVVILIILAAGAVVLLGSLIAELLGEHRHMKIMLPKLLEELRTTDDISAAITSSGLLKRQKAALTELAAHPDFSVEAREALAVRLMEVEQARYDRILRFSELTSKLGPMFGLLGTLIPLGPGIIALGQGDTFTLSQSLLTAFDTTIAGLVAAAIATVVSTVRKAWYKDYMSILETTAELLLNLIGGEQT